MYDVGLGNRQGWGEMPFRGTLPRFRCIATVAQTVLIEQVAHGFVAMHAADGFTQ